MIVEMKCVGFAFIFMSATCTFEVPETTTVICPPVREWSKDFQKRMADELRKLPQGTAIGTVVTQSIGDRDLARACAASVAAKRAKQKAK